MSLKNSPKFKFTLLVSLLLHVALIAFLGFSAFVYVSPLAGNVNGNAVDAIMVDPAIMTQQYQRQLEQKNALQRIEEQRAQQAEQRERELQEKQAAERQRIKELERERLAALEQQKIEAAAAQAALEAKQLAEKEAIRAKAVLEEQQKQALLAKQKAEEEAKLRAQREVAEKQRIERERVAAEAARQKAVEEAEKAKLEAERQKQIAEQERLRAAQEKQQAAEEAQRQQALDDILGSLTSSTPKVQQGVSSAELDNYKMLVHNAISNKFINAQIYSGKNCVLRIQIAADGLLLGVEAIEGDQLLCREAISATKLAVIPKPANNLIYQQMKNITIDFRPK